MSLSFLSEFIQNKIGCWHFQSDITKVQVSVANDHPQYCVLATCKRCNVSTDYVVSHPKESDTRAVAAAAWLTKNNFDFVTGKPLN